MHPLSCSSLVGLTVAVALGLAASPPVAAEDAVLINRVPTADEFVEALAPKAPEAPAIRTRGIGRQTATAPVEVRSDTASAVDLPIVTFEFNSDDLTPNARATLDNLATALGSERLSSFAFVIEGHTDAVGAEEYNQSLSERRAAAVRGYLVNQHRIDARRLDAVGKGEHDLLPTYAPNADIQRRVRIVNGGAGNW